MTFQSGPQSQSAHQSAEREDLSSGGQRDHETAVGPVMQLENTITQGRHHVADESINTIRVTATEGSLKSQEIAGRNQPRRPER
ncbi:hypothetical protein PY730_27825 (plasmid) [Klebsiella pneumoniae]|nr:hypothetical protein PY730_27825 [Klebsiella pneumoniae]